MQGHGSSLTTVPENSSFDHGSTSSEPVNDSQISWNDNGYDVNADISRTKNTHISVGSSNDHKSSFIGDSSGLSPEYVMEGSENGPGRSLDGPRTSCKRKSVEVQVGQSERSNVSTINGPGPTNPRLRLGVGGPPLVVNPLSSAVENSRRNFRLGIDGSCHHDRDISGGNPFLLGPEPVDADNSYSQNSPSLVMRDHLLDFDPSPAVENGSVLSQSDLLHVRRNTRSRWGGSISSRTSNSSFPDETNPMVHDESMYWNNNNIAGNVSSTSRTGLGSGMDSSGPSWANRTPPQYSRRLSEIVRRSSLSTAGIESSGSQGSGEARSQARGPGSSQGTHGRNLLNTISALSDRQQVDGGLGLPYSLRSLSGGGGEGRARSMSEIRHVLDLMRRGEALRFEDMMILDHSVLFGMADLHDRHREMRLDVDNMSYEELLTLGERIGNVSTGLNEETITSRLKQRKFTNVGTENPAETEPCSFCREEYNVGEDLGILECGHEFHRDCIRKWLMNKNLCPICKTTGLTM